MGHAAHVPSVYNSNLHLPMSTLKLETPLKGTTTCALHREVSFMEFLIGEVPLYVQGLLLEFYQLGYW